MSKETTWESLRARAVERGQITEDGVRQARAEQDAHEAGYRLMELRQHTGMTQTDVAHQMGVSQARVSAMERGEIDQLTVSTVRAYMTALGGGVRIVASVDNSAFDLRLPATMG